MIEFQAQYFDGKSSQAHQVLVSVGKDLLLRISNDEFEETFHFNQIQLSPSTGQAVGVIFLPQDAELHSSNHEALKILWEARPGFSIQQLAHKLEGSLTYVFIALVFSVIFIFSGLRWGVPLLAEGLAHTLPAVVESQMGEQSFAVMEKIYLKPSKLPIAKQQQLAKKLKQLCQQQACPNYQLYFRHSEALGANAFALPSGYVVVTDDLIELAENNEEVIAVVAHELGHVVARHSLRSALQSIGAGIILVAITGDVSNVSDLAAGLPSLLLKNGYSRDMEREADLYALNWLQQADIPKQNFANILTRLDEHPGGKTGLFDTHPATPERTAMFK